MPFPLNFCPRQRSSSTSSLPTTSGGQSSSSSRKSRAAGDVVKPESPTMKQDQRSKIKKVLQTLATSATSTSSRREDYKYTRLNSNEALSNEELPVKDNSAAHMPPEMSYGAMPYFEYRLFDGNACITGFQLCASRSVRHIK